MRSTKAAYDPQDREKGKRELENVRVANEGYGEDLVIRTDSA